MATLQIAPNKLVTCPYDPAHKMKASRYQLHVSKCKLNNLNNQKVACPFNAQHLCGKGELEHHLLQCPDRGVLDKQLVASAEGNTQYKGHTGVPAYYPQPAVEPDDAWDTDMTVCPMTRFEPSVEPPNGGIRTDFAFVKPAERRNYYHSLHARQPDGDDSSNSLEQGKMASLPDLRSPKSNSQVEDEQKPVHELRNIGLGRGQPATSTSSRIAANIFGQQQSMRQPRSTPNVPGFQSTNLGMGRGSCGPLLDGEAESVNKADFNNVGMGRGSKRH